MAEKRFRVLFMIFSESYFATAPFSRKRSEPSTASTLPASGCGECLVPHFDHLELRGPAFGFKAVALGSHGALLGAPLCGLGHIRVGHIRKGGSNVAAAICNALIYSAAEMLDPSARGWNG